MIKLLLKKEFKTQILWTLKKNIKRPLNSFISLFTYSIIMGVIIFIFLKLLKGFAIYDLQKELLIIAISIGVIVQIINALIPTTNYLYFNEDYHILQPLPLKPQDIVVSKIVILYFKELLASLIIISPILIAYGINQNLQFSYYLLSLFVYLLLPIIPLLINILLSGLIAIIKKQFGSYQLLTFVFYLVVVIIGFILYQDLLELLISFVNENRLPNLFNIQTAETLKIISKCLVPVNIIVNVIIQYQVYLYLPLVIVISIVLLFICIIINNRSYEKLIKHGSYQKQKHSIYQNRLFINLLKKSKPKKGIMIKEIITLIRNPEVVSSYLSILVIMPIISYLMIDVVNEVVVRTFGINYRLPFVLMLLILLVGMANIFTSVLISKEGTNIDTLKTLPISFKSQIKMKIFIASLLQLGSIILTMVTLLIAKQINIDELLIISTCIVIIGEAIIISAINRDLIHPSFKTKLDENSNSALLIGNTFLVALIIGAFLFVMIIMDTNLINITNLLIIVVAILYLALTIVGLRTNIDNKIEVMNE